MIEIMKQIAAKHGVKLSPPAPPDAIEQAQTALVLPQSLCEFFSITNGLQHEWFRIPPLHDTTRPKETWDSLQRMNDPEKSKFLRGRADLLKDFIVFAELSGPDCAAIRATDSRIWFTEKGSLHETDMTLIELITSCLLEVDEL